MVAQSRDEAFTPTPDGSSGHMEPAELPRGLLPRDFDDIDPRMRLPGPIPFDARLDERAFALEHRLHAAVVLVPDVSVEAELLRLLLAMSSEVHALHATSKHDSRADVHMPEFAVLSNNLI